MFVKAKNLKGLWVILNLDEVVAVLPDPENRDHCIVYTTNPELEEMKVQGHIDDFANMLSARTWL